MRQPFRKTRCFLELKKKSDGVVYRRRCQLPLEEALSLCQGRRQPQGQIEKELVWSARREGGVSPVCALAYEREAFYGETGGMAQGPGRQGMGGSSALPDQNAGSGTSSGTQDTAGSDGTESAESSFSSLEA